MIGAALRTAILLAVLTAAAIASSIGPGWAEQPEIGFRFELRIHVVGLDGRPVEKGRVEIKTKETGHVLTAKLEHGVADVWLRCYDENYPAFHHTVTAETELGRVSIEIKTHADVCARHRNLIVRYGDDNKLNPL